MKKLFIFTFALLLCGCTSGHKTAKSMTDYKQIDIKDLRESPVRLFADDWALLTAGNTDKFNTMTISWGTIGHLWNKPLAMVFVRPQRYTFEFMESNEYFTLSFFDMPKYRDALSLLGSMSGRDGDKVAEAGLLPIETPNSISFGEANMIIECRKLYGDFLNPEKFIDTTFINKIYPQNDFHKVYVGEIVGVWKR